MRDAERGERIERKLRDSLQRRDAELGEPLLRVNLVDERMLPCVRRLRALLLRPRLRRRAAQVAAPLASMCAAPSPAAISSGLMRPSESASSAANTDCEPPHSSRVMNPSPSRS